MARVQSRLLIVVAAALALPGCTDNEMMGNITAVLGMIAGAIGVIQKMAASTQGIATRVKTGVFVFVTGLCLGCTGCFWLFVDENFQFETAFSRAGQRLGELFKEKTPPPEQAKEGAMDEAAKDQPAPHNWLIARATCPKCRYSGDLVTAFKFGECALRVYRLGDQVRWGGRRRGRGPTPASGSAPSPRAVPTAARSSSSSRRGSSGTSSWPSSPSPTPRSGAGATGSWATCCGEDVSDPLTTAAIG